jgi:hypothetical protein
MACAVLPDAWKWGVMACDTCQMQQCCAQITACANDAACAAAYNCSNVCANADGGTTDACFNACADGAGASKAMFLAQDDCVGTTCAASCK